MVVDVDALVVVGVDVLVVVGTDVGTNSCVEVFGVSDSGICEGKISVVVGRSVGSIVTDGSNALLECPSSPLPDDPSTVVAGEGALVETTGVV